jgi:uncharacterized membrane protein SpoIIM required for sporulation
MNLDGWLGHRRPVWKRLETIVDQLVRRGPRRTPAKDVAELIELYPSVCADLARLRAIGAEPDLVEPLNRLIIRAHGQVYRGAPASPWSLGAFFLSDYPRLFRQTWRFTLASFLISLITACAAYRTVQESPQIVADILGGADGEFYGQKSVADIRERFGHEGNPMLSSFVITNNIRVALTAFALGISFGLGTIWVLAVNGAMLGGIAGAFAKSGIQWQMWMVILPHGALELSAIVIAGGAGLMVGHGLWAPGQRTRARALREDVVRAMQLAVGLVPAFALAGLIEGLVTPSDAIPEGLKLTLGIALAVIFWLYLLLAGRQEAPARRSPPKALQTG